MLSHGTQPIALSSPIVLEEVLSLKVMHKSSHLNMWDLMQNYCVYI
jgi:hypothetical protein